MFELKYDIYIFLIILMNFNLIWPFFTPICRWIAQIKLFRRMEKILFFILQYKETFPFGFFEKYHTPLYEELKVTLNTPIFRGEFHPVNSLHGP